MTDHLRHLTQISSGTAGLRATQGLATFSTGCAVSHNLALSSALAVLLPLTLGELKSRRDDRFRREATRAIERVAVAGGRGSLDAPGGAFTLDGTGKSTA